MPSIEIVDLYKKAQDDAKFNADKAWETIKFCTTVSSTLITVAVSLLGAINFLAIGLVVKALLTGTLILFPMMIMKIVHVAEENFQRECNRMYESIAILMKIEEELPKRIHLNRDSHFTDENRYTPSKWDEKKYPTTGKFIEAMMNESDKFHSSMRPVFSVLRLASYVLLSIVSFIFLVTITPFFVDTLKLFSLCEDLALVGWFVVFLAWFFGYYFMLIW